ncbi:NlpC/P60 family protein [Salinarimonas rosea]|uniref:NlpC/P60 family protein n=1 Tax=Salinarimonas rosea TaxID=552063 RepID=UPI0004200E95|nr:NlpC/P60 family protein [Salinarimonas rosea]
MSPDPAACVVAEARAWIGTPYAHQASLKGVGCDCLGLLRGVWRGVVGPEPERPGPYAPDWAEAGAGDALMRAATRWLVPVEGIAAGRVLVFRWREGLCAKHCAIATGPDAMIHAHDGARVCEVTIPPFWRRKVAGVFAFPSRPLGAGTIRAADQGRGPVI